MKALPWLVSAWGSFELFESSLLNKILSKTEKVKISDFGRLYYCTIKFCVPRRVVSTKVSNSECTCSEIFPHTVVQWNSTMKLCGHTLLWWENITTCSNLPNSQANWHYENFPSFSCWLLVSSKVKHTLIASFSTFSHALCVQCSLYC